MKNLLLAILFMLPALAANAADTNRTLNFKSGDWFIVHPYDGIPLGPAQSAPLDVNYDIDGDGNVIVRHVPSAGVGAESCSRNYRPGRHELKITGRVLSADARTKLVGTLIAAHSDTDACRGYRKDMKFLLRPDIFASTTATTVTVPLDFPEEYFICERCGKKFPLCIFIFAVRLVEPEPGKSYDDFGFEISAAALSGPSDFAASDEPKLEDLLRDARDIRRKNAEKHRADFAQFTFSNKFDPTRTTPPTDEEKNARDLQRKMYFFEDELKAANPDLEIKRLAEWNFTYSSDCPSYLRLPFAPNGVEVSGVCNGIVFASRTDYIAVIPPGTDRWQYTWIAFPDNAIPRAKPLPEAGDGVIFTNGRPVRRLADGKEITPPKDIRFFEGNHAVAGNRIFYIAQNSGKLLAMSPDFSTAEPAAVAPPAIPGVAWNDRVEKISNGADGDHLLIVFSGKRFGVEVSALVEANVKTGVSTLKMPLAYGLAFAYNLSGVFIDPGPGLPLFAAADARLPNEFRTFEPPRLPATAVMLKPYDPVNGDLRLGRYLVMREYDPVGHRLSGCILLDMFEPRNSIIMNGFDRSKHISAAADGKSLLVTMPDGLYQVSPKVMPPSPQIVMPEADLYPHSIPPGEVLKNLQLDDPTLFSAEFTERGLEFALSPSGSDAVISVDVDREKLPPSPKKYLLFFNREFNNVAGEYRTDYGIVSMSSGNMMEFDGDARELRFRKMDAPGSDNLILTHILIQNPNDNGQN